MKNTPQSGNAIIWILIAVALFAAVTAAVMRSSNTSTSVITGEQAAAYANQLIAYGNDISSTVKRVSLRGCADNQISFSNNILVERDGDVMYPDNHNGNAPTDGSCDVFKTAGGGLTPKTFPQMVTDDGLGGSAPEYAHFVLAQINGVGTPAPEIALYMEKVHPDICKKISQMAGTGDTPPVDNNESWVSYDGDLDSAGYMVFGNESTSLEGKSMFCVEQSADSGLYQFIQVLLPR